MNSFSNWIAFLFKLNYNRVHFKCYFVRVFPSWPVNLLNKKNVDFKQKSATRYICKFCNHANFIECVTDVVANRQNCVCKNFRCFYSLSQGKNVRRKCFMVIRIKYHWPTALIFCVLERLLVSVYIWNENNKKIFNPSFLLLQYKGYYWRTFSSLLNFSWL